MKVQRQVLFWLFVAVAFFLLVALLKDILLPFVAGMVLAYFLNPMADALERVGMGRVTSAILIVVVVGLVVALALILLVPFIANQLRQLTDNLPADLDRLKQAFEAWVASWLGDRFPMVRPGLERRPPRRGR